MEAQRFDVVVVGARVAGSTLAALLGDAGRCVLLVDRAPFPSTTPSTHFFRGGGMVGVLARLGVLHEVLSHGSPPLVREYLYRAGSPQPTVGPPQNPGEIGYGLSVRRELLDHLLVQRALRSGNVEFAERTSLVSLLWEDGRVVGARLRAPEGERDVRARVVVGADGRHSAVARAVAAPEERADPPIRALYYTYVRDLPGPGGDPPDGPEFSFVEDEVAYIFPSDSGVSCVALSVNLETFRWMRGAAPERFRERVGQHRGIAERFAASTTASKLLGTGPERSFVRVPLGPGWALVGDAGMHQDPWSGLGMDMAGMHAGFLAEALLEALDGSTSEAEAMRGYHTRRDTHGLPGYRQTAALGRDLRQLS